MDRSGFLMALNHEARGLQSGLTAKSRQWFVNLVATGIDARPPDGGPPKCVPIDRVYELMCFFYIAGALCRAASAWRLIPGLGEHGYRLPYASGAKHNFAFLRFHFGDEVYDLCCGVKLPILDEPEEAPDITLQEVDGSNNERSVGKVVGLWEGKYHSKKYKLSRADVAQMVSRCDILRLGRCHAGDILDRIVPEPFKINAVVSNSPYAVFNRDQRLRWCFSIVFQFDGTSAPMVEPTRAEQLAHRRNRLVT